jgi:hypothetical protein
MARRFYVYVLEDPRDGSTFYVGKGLGLRMYQHAVEARRDNGRGNRRKIERIKAILESGAEIIARQIAEYDDEQDAFEHEAELIAATQGLTNILARGGGWSLTKEEYERRQADRAARILAKGKAQLRERLKVWDEWERRGWEITFPGMKNGDEKAREYVQLVREFAAA